MGKTLKGALWLDAEKTSPYEFYQYWRNVDDADVTNFLKLLTFLPLGEIAEYEKLSGSGLNKIKELLAFEITKNIHGEDEALKAQTAARALFGGGADGGSVPETEIGADSVKDGITVIDLMAAGGLTGSKSEGRRLIEQGGVKINGEKISDIEHRLFPDDFKDPLMLQKGKKSFHRFVLKINS